MPTIRPVQPLPMPSCNREWYLPTWMRFVKIDACFYIQLCRAESPYRAVRYIFLIDFMIIILQFYFWYTKLASLPSLLPRSGLIIVTPFDAKISNSSLSSPFSRSLVLLCKIDKSLCSSLPNGGVGIPLFPMLWPLLSFRWDRLKIMFERACLDDAVMSTSDDSSGRRVAREHAKRPVPSSMIHIIIKGATVSAKR